MVWIDLEMTRLDVQKDKIIEIAVILTDKNCENLIDGPELIVQCDKNLLDGMDEWCTNTHKNSGLTD